MKSKLLFIGGLGIGRDDDPFSFEILWRLNNLIIKNAGETGGDALEKHFALLEDMQILHKDGIEAAQKKASWMINSAMHDDKIGNYFDPEGVIDIN